MKISTQNNEEPYYRRIVLELNFMLSYLDVSSFKEFHGIFHILSIS